MVVVVAPPCIGRGQRIIIILSWQLCHKLFFPYALPLASAGVGGYYLQTRACVVE